ncbi:hypothetical protein [Lunatibacter salilacus]|uniref:hypothetical protein n=1 Tax=Lunatibacter salilacus TaxID=2483804 RepID=UPI00131D2875|nr:hypothetical protein [Lunatibacter salilacus]
MEGIFKKLNYKGQPVVHVLQAPESFNTELAVLEGKATIERHATGEIHFVIGFVQLREKLDAMVHEIAPKLMGDAVFWIAYPKGKSKNYTCDFNRDTGWEAMGSYGLEPIRQVSIDDDWSALRFRKVGYIKSLTRKFGALSEEGKKKIGN